MTQTVVSDRTAKFALAIDRFALDLAQHWLAYVNLFIGILVVAPFLAPALMAIGCQQFRICDTGRCPVGIDYEFHQQDTVSIAMNLRNPYTSFRECPQSVHFSVFPGFFSFLAPVF